MTQSESQRPTFGANDAPMDVLVKLSRYYGSDPEFVLAGGGNTSVKTGEVLYVKASGFSLADITAEGFVALDRQRLFQLQDSDLGDDPSSREERFKQGLAAARVQERTTLRPSVESILHNLVPERYVIHAHPVLANALTCWERGKELTQELFGDDVVWVPYVEPGFRLGRAIAAALADYRKRTGRARPEAMLLQNHGLVVSGDTPDEILSRTDHVAGKIRQALASTPEMGVFGEVSRMDGARARGLIEILAPALRALLAQDDPLAIVTFDDSDVVLSLVGAVDGPSIAALGPLLPDQIVYSGSYPLWFEPPQGEDVDTLISSLRDAIAGHIRRTAFAPKVVLVKGLGMFAAGESHKAADYARQVYAGVIRLMSCARRLGGHRDSKPLLPRPGHGLRPMTDQERDFIAGWEGEAYRQRVARGGGPSGRAAGKVAVVTGAAQGFGLGIAQDLAGQGAHVVLADVNAEGAQRAADDLVAQFGSGRALSLAMDVTDAASVADAMHRVVRTFGGFDLLVSNAGVLRADSVKTQSEDEFDFVTRVNYKGYFLCVQKAAPVLAVQHRARPGYWSDIVQINSKSGLIGSNRNAAYAGSKFGALGLTESFALELLADGIKVNAVCPGNFFDGPLWSDPENGLFVQYLRTGKVPGARTLQDVRRAYEAKVPMGRGCTVADVMKAIYYCMEQQYETGQAIPVTGGQVMLR